MLHKCRGAVGEDLYCLPKVVGSRPQKPGREVKVSVGEDLRGPHRGGVGAQVGIDHQRRRHRLLVEDPFLSAAIRSRVGRAAEVPVIEEHDRRVVDIDHVVLVGEPRVCDAGRCNGGETAPLT